MDEILDLVDGEDRVIGTVRKLDTDTDPELIHREIAVLVHRDGELLWQLRSAAKTVLPLVWDVACAGHVLDGERRGEVGSQRHAAILARRCGHFKSRDSRRSLSTRPSVWQTGQ